MCFCSRQDRVCGSSAPRLTRQLLSPPQPPVPSSPLLAPQHPQGGGLKAVNVHELSTEGPFARLAAMKARQEQAVAAQPQVVPASPAPSDAAPSTRPAVPEPMDCSISVNHLQFSYPGAGEFPTTPAPARWVVVNRALPQGSSRPAITL